MYKVDEKVWIYTYEFGLLEAFFLRYDASSTCHIEYRKGKTVFPKLIELINVHKTEDLARDYATAINFKRGWLRREWENNPSAEYDLQKTQSIESFPEMWI